MATSDADISAGLTVTIGSQGSKCCVAPAVLNLIESGCRGWNAECGKTKMILRTGIEPVTLRCTRGIQLQSHALPTELSKAIYRKHYNVYNNNSRTDDIMIMIGATETLSTWPPAILASSLRCFLSASFSSPVWCLAVYGYVFKYPLDSVARSAIPKLDLDHWRCRSPRIHPRRNSIMAC